MTELLVWLDELDVTENNNKVNGRGDDVDVDADDVLPDVMLLDVLELLDFVMRLDKLDDVEDDEGGW